MTDDEKPLPAGVSFRPAGEGDLGPLIRAKDWSQTSIGPRDSWPQTLHGYVSMILSLPTPAIIFWGAEHVQIYNDGYSTIMGPRHPRHLGSPYAECWPDTYPTIHPWMKRVLRGEVVEVERTLLPVTRYGFNEEAFFTFTFSPLRDDRGEIGGFLQIVTEMTAQVISERRAATLQGLVPSPSDSHRGLSRVIKVLASNPSDISLALYFLPSEDGPLALQGSTGLDAATLSDTSMASLRAVAERVFAANRPEEISNWQSLVPTAAAGPWPEQTSTVIALPVSRSAEAPRGVIFLGVSPRLRFDAKYREFFDRVSHELASNLALHREWMLADQLKLTLDSAKMGTWHIDLRTGRVTLSERTLQFLGEDANHARDFTQINLNRVHPDDLDRVNRAWRKSIDDNELYAIEYRIRRPDGEVRWMSSWGKTSYDALGSPLTLAGVSMDVTESKRAEAVLRESEMRFRFMADAMPQITWMAAPLTGDITYVSQQWFEYSGLPREGSLSPGWQAAVHPEDASVVERWRAALKSEQPLEAELRLRRGDGAYRHYLLRVGPIRSAEGTLLHWLGTLTDLHERKVAEAEAQSEQRKFEAIFVDSPAAMALTRGREHVFEKVNRNYERLLGGRPLVGKKLVEALPEFVGQPFFALMDDVFSTGRPFVGREMPAFVAKEPGAEPTEGFYNFTYSRIVGSDGAPYGVYVHAIEVTEQVEGRRKIERLVDELGRAVRVRDEFMSIASHELKTPLSSLRLHTQAIQRAISKNDASAFSPGRVSRLVDQTDRQTRRLSRLVDDMLDVARINTGKFSLLKQPTELSHLMAEATERMRPEFESVPMVLDFSSAGPAPCDVDRDRIEQVLANLLTNALRYGNRQPVHVHVSTRSGSARVAVRDRGPGIDKASQERVFERFERAISANEVSGLGLGLFIARQIVEGHGGRLWVESEPGQGASFLFELPLSVPR